MPGLFFLVREVSVKLFQGPAEDDLLYFEKLAANRGFRTIAGVDEAGRGPLAGPVVAAAVILPADCKLDGVRDSKKLSPAKREKLYDVILAAAEAVGVGIADHEAVDRLNILQATLTAMKQAVASLRISADYLLVDGTFAVPVKLPQNTIIKGDDRSLSIAAASIIAKVTRDRMMVEYDLTYPGYGFADHKGYASATHLSAICTLGPCPIHRRTFGGVREHLEQGDGVSDLTLPF
jgi:ribonuclease HII